jgi:hypothetical protein
MGSAVQFTSMTERWNMKIKTVKFPIVVLLVVVAAVFGNWEHLGLVIPFVFAHCDTMDGPVVAEAKKALETGDITPVLKWVRQEDEGAVRDVFESALSVRALGPEALALADRYFFETLVRVHRASEGAPFTGLKPAGTGVTPAERAADEALEKGSVEELAAETAHRLEHEIRARFARVQETKKRADDSVQAGREYVEAYIRYVHFVDGIDRMLAGHGEGRMHAEHGEGDGHH